jgi:thymidylate synthase
MHIKAATIDDLLRKVYGKLVQSKNRVTPTRGNTLELTGVLLHLKNPRARLSRTEIRGIIFSCIGEFLWYLTKKNELSFIEYYIKKYKDESTDGLTVHGGYGPRLFKSRGINQVENVLDLLKKNPNSRRAVIQLFDPEDLAKDYKEIPCTCTIQLMVRQKKLHMFTQMRSNDAYKGLPHDIFAFTMLQELFARILSVEIGEYKHYVGSLHLYESDIENTKNFLNEGWQETVLMPPMPRGDPWSSIKLVLAAEKRIRKRKFDNNTSQKIDPYWADLLRLLEIYRLDKEEDKKQVSAIKKNMSSQVYNMYINKRQARKKHVQPEQLNLPAVL